MIVCNIQRLLQEISPNVTLVAVSKFQPVPLILEAYNSGLLVFGESRSREMLQKIPLLPQDIQWHFIGHLQTNKVKDVVGRAAVIQSVDSVRLLNAIQKQASQTGIVQDVLLQVHIAVEKTKNGFLPSELPQAFTLSLPNTRICGLMGMATLTEDKDQVRSEFRMLRQLFETLRSGPFAGNEAFCHCSMGMSGDYPIALEEGSTMVRIGSAIFPSRPQKP